MKNILLVIALTMTTANFAPGQEMTHGVQDKQISTGAESAKDIGIYTASGIKWTTGPASLPLGAKLAVLEGDPTKEGFFTMRLWLPNGFRISPHWHPKTEHVTVISGTFNLGMGEKFDQKTTRAMPAGTFGFWQEGMRHFAWAKGDTVIQLHGIGPWTIKYVSPADDPRNQKK
ncbi:MAG: cupin domain-containing protein [Pyrinomonadaceae bacterium]